MSVSLIRVQVADFSLLRESHEGSFELAALFILVCWVSGLLWLSGFPDFRLVLHLSLSNVCCLQFAVCSLHGCGINWVLELL
jgi:hypothetical protein